MFFALPYEYTPAGLFKPAHLALLAVTVIGVFVALLFSRGMDVSAVRRAVLAVTLSLWVLEVLKLIFVLAVTKSQNPNEYMPLYYCSLTLPAGLMSAWGSGRVRLTGDAFLATGGLVGGLVFLLFPTTALLRYPALHAISLHSFLLHGLMVYLGLLLLLRGTYRVLLRDVKYVAGLVSLMCVLALAFNLIYDRVSGHRVANLMFLSKDFPGTPLSPLYHALGVFYTPVVWLAQAFLPFLLVFAVSRAFSVTFRKGV